ncbi:MAG: PilZ domain-containing protein [Deltaproteobacteria bacterium]|nr:PilZ domain-containing protein [Deltaproteobacteria bacterium]
MSSADRRQNPRILYHVPVAFGPDDPTSVGFTRNLSLGGMEIASRFVFETNTALRLTIESDPDDLRTVGTVRWTTSLGHLDDAARDFYERHYTRSMGIQLLDPPPAWPELVRQVSETPEGPRRTPRFRKVYRVNVRSMNQLLEMFTDDISRGGLFVLSDKPPALGAFVSVEVVVPETMRVLRADGRVVHHLPRELADALGRNAGFGVEFVDFAGTDREVLEGYIDHLIAGER